MFLCQVLVLNFILLQVPAVRSSGSAWSFLTSSSTKPNGIVAGVLPSVSDPYLSKGTEPSHHEALRLLKALGSRSSCHSEATSSLLVDCVALEGDVLDVNVKISYAVRLAICEFKSTGVSYPSECKTLGSVGSGAYKATPARQKCIKKLEEKPQHWTTLSNNIQNAVVLCAAARHEIDKEELLSLHINITKIQQGLFNAVHTQLNEAWEALQAKRMWDAEVKASQQDTLDTLHQLKESVINVLRGSNDKASSIIEELAKQLQLAKESSNVLSDELKKSIQTLTESMAEILLKIPIAWNQMEASTREMANGQIGSLQQSGRLAQQLQDSLELSKAFMVDNLEISMGHLSATVSFTSLSSSYSNLKSTEYELTSSLQLQQSLHNQMLSSIEKASETTDHFMAALAFAMATALMNESYYLNNNSTTHREEPRLVVEPELPMAMTKSSQIPLHVRAWVWFVVIVGGFTLLAFYFNGYCRYWGGRKASLSRFPLPYHLSGPTKTLIYNPGIPSENHRHPLTQQELGGPRRRINDICIF
ncbi:hypothetical protein L211DRAFT_848836 [Terfezia boudieri ATCC MYA-4762]|uniref:Karyogamy protein 5 n=1 Tax=Terfezia boudieri ATCC MYA-4762 TaxID=1051890 RepID=A0A3N4LS70_9PEZI|nr:hypothetical protein L211DRAFT_848836 [Terfezia boudieri ATCC MYA-4762]